MKSKKHEPVYQPTEREREASIEVYSRYEAQQTARVKGTLNDNNTATVSFDHPERVWALALLMKAIGTTDYEFTISLLDQLLRAASTGTQCDEKKLNFMIAVIKGIQPKDQIEAMLAAHIAAVHLAIMNFVHQLSNVGNNLTAQEMIERGLNKLNRTYAMQMEALKRYRTGGEQKVTVQHVSVGEGGQAIVGNVTQTASKTSPEKSANGTPALINAQQAPMTKIRSKERSAVASQRNRKDAKRSSA